MRSEGKMTPVLLFRASLSEEGELEVAKKYFETVESRIGLSNSLVIGRYSVLPYYAELESDLVLQGSRLINSHAQHKWIADFEYYDVLSGYTFESWDDSNFYLCKHSGPFVVKGKTNSKKHSWDTHMFAEWREDALEIACMLKGDGLIGSQDIIYRKYEALEVLSDIDMGGGLKITNEWRLFYYKDRLLSYGYYWTEYDSKALYLPLAGLEFAQKVAEIAKDYVNFFVIDIAKKRDESWIMVELNDGQMSGLSANIPDTLYKNLKTLLEKEK